MQPGRWNEDATQVVKTRIVVNGFERTGRARIDAQCYDGHPSKAARSPAATCTLTLDPPWSTSRVSPSPTLALVGMVDPTYATQVAWPPLVGQSVTVDVGDGVRWWRCFTGRVDETGGSLLGGSVQVECVDESVLLDQRLRAPRAAQHRSVAFFETPGFLPGKYGPFDLTAATLVDYAARSCGWSPSIGQAWDTNLLVPMAGSAHPYAGDVYAARSGAGTAGDRAQWSADSVFQPGNKHITYQLRGTLASPVEVTMDLPMRVSGTGWTTASLRGSADTISGRGPFIAYDHNADVIRFGLRDSAVGATAATPTVVVQGATIPRGAATRVVMRFTPRTPTATQHRFEVRTNAGATVDVSLTDASATIPAGWVPKFLEYMSGGPMGALQAVCNPTAPWGHLNLTPNVRIRHRQPPWLDATRDLGTMTGRDVLTKLADAECGAFWVDRHGSLQYAGPRVRESQEPVATLTTDLDVIDWAWVHTFEQRAKRYRIDRLECATQPTKHNSLLWDNPSGGESIGQGELWEKIVAADDDEDWLWVDTTSIQMYSDRTRSDLVGSTTHGGTLVDSAGGEAWEAFQVTWALQQLGNRAVKWSAHASNTLGLDRAIDLRIPTNADNLPAWWRGKSLPRLLGSRITWISKSEVNDLSNPLGNEEYVHDAGWYVQHPDRLADLRDFVSGALSSSPMPVFEDVPVRADPRIDIGDKVALEDKHYSFIKYFCVVLGYVLDVEDGAASMRLKVRPDAAVITDSAALTAALHREPHWLQNQPSFTRST
ncbi:hypothetical protein [Janibacter terrae]|uniref:hypothetical protein n=1 Tax=Janibacter terrae TaxID=103817 RepID=UPI0031F9E920